MTAAQVTFTAGELLADHAYAEPLVADGVRCHGGFDDEGRYVSPRTRHRVPAIEAWDAQRLAATGSPKLDVPEDAWPASFPTVEQSRFLLGHGITAPTVSALTRIGTVEGFGGMLRLLPVPGFSRLFAEGIEGTAIAHLGTGLFEAHARDEAGWGEEAGHDRMWFAARDIAFERPVTEDQTAIMLERMGIAGVGTPEPGTAAAAARFAELRRQAEATRALPSDLPIEVELVLGRIIGLLFIEIAAFHGFRWAEAVLADTELVAGDGEAAQIISYIRADETPHVGYLLTTLSEMRDRTWVGATGTRYDGAEMLGAIWQRALGQSLVARRHDNVKLSLAEIRHALADRADAEDLLAEMLTLGQVQVLPDGEIVDERPPSSDRLADLVPAT
jgi:hypothetical protein